MSPTDIVLAIFLALTICGGAWLGFHLLTQNGRLLVRLELLERQLVKQGVLQGTPGVLAGTLLNNFALPMLGGGMVTLAEWRGRKVALIYLNPRCQHCETLLPALAAALPQGIKSDPVALIVSSGSEEENQRFFAKHRPACPIALQEGSEVSGIHGASATPMAYLVDEAGNTVGKAAVGGEALLGVLRGEVPSAEPVVSSQSSTKTKGSLASSKINRDGLKAGTRAPDFSLPALDGSEISLKSYRGRRVLLVFSDPQCAPCTALLPKLEQLHRNSDDLQLLLIGRGESEENREKARSLGLTFPIVLQRSWEISRAYGMFATPIGYLVGEDGLLVEDVAVGGNAILALATRERVAGAQVGT